MKNFKIIKKATLLLSLLSFSFITLAQITINEDKTYDPYHLPPANVKDGLVLEDNCKVIIKDLSIGFESSAQIVVNKGCILIIDQAKLTSKYYFDGTEWQGIVIKGHAGKKQSVKNIVQNIGEQGMVILKGHKTSYNDVSYAKICNASIGVKVEDGGILRAYNTMFYNCAFGVEFTPYESPDKPDKNLSCFDECLFTWTKKGVLVDYDDTEEPEDSDDDFIHIHLNNVNGVKILGCQFYSFLGLAKLNNGNCPRGCGIRVSNSEVVIQKSTHYYGPSQSCSPNGKKNHFKNLEIGVFCKNDNGTEADENELNILECKFHDCHKSILLDGVRNANIYKNEIDLHFWNTCDLYSIYILSNIITSNNNIIENKFRIIPEYVISLNPLVQVKDSTSNAVSEHHKCIFDRSQYAYTNNYYKNVFQFKKLPYYLGLSAAITGIKFDVNYLYTGSREYNIRCNNFNFNQYSLDNLWNILIEYPCNEPYNISIGNISLPACNNFKVQSSKTKHLKVQGTVPNTSFNYYLTNTNSEHPYSNYVFGFNLLNSTDNPTCDDCCDDSEPCNFYPNILDVVDISEDLDVGSIVEGYDGFIEADNPWNVTGTIFNINDDDPTPYFDTVAQVLRKAIPDTLKENIFMGNELIKIYPNPLVNQSTIHFNKPKKYTINIYDNLGKLVKCIKTDDTKHNVIINRSIFTTNGVYHVIVTFNGKYILKENLIVY